MSSAALPSLDRYERHLGETSDWLHRSIDRGRGGSSAHFSVVTGWARPYPETTGYLIPTLLDLGDHDDDPRHLARARALGEWLLGIQDPEGSWRGGQHPPRTPAEQRGSVFNTGQILEGMVALARRDDDPRYREAALRGAHWLAAGLGDDGLWSARDYRAAATPTYYTRVAWPMLEVWALTDDEALRQAADAVLAALLERRDADGFFQGMSFRPDQPAFLHTIAYTLRGFLESARLLGSWEPYGACAAEGLRRLARRADLTGGRIPGAFGPGWRKAGDALCLTGNVQLALCLLLLDEREPDLRRVNTAAKLVDVVCGTQLLSGPIGALRGGVAGSWPLWGRYMTLRYPNWAAKFHADALLRLLARLRQEL